jgi:hypothetical protein
MEESNSAEEDSVFLSADEDDTSCSDDSGGQSDGERSKRGGGEGNGVTISTNGGAQEELGLAPSHSLQKTAGVQQYCECQRIYLEAQNSKKTLHVLSIGLVFDDGTQPFSFDNELWSKLPKASMRPQNLEYL